MSKRVGFIGFHTDPGGIGQDMLQLMNAIAESNVEVDLLISEAAGPYIEQLGIGVNVVPLGDTGRITRLRKVMAYLQCYQPAAVLGNHDRDNQILTLARHLAHSPVRIIIRVGNTKSVIFRRRHWWQRIPQRYLFRQVCRQADALICLVRGVAEDTAQVGEIAQDKIHVLPNTTIPADLEWRANECLPDESFFNTDEACLVAAGRLTAQKDYPMLLNALKLLRERRPCRLIVLGEGNQRQYLESLAGRLGIEKSVHFLGFVDNPYAYMRRASAFVLSSRWEGFGNVLAEAMAVGTPVVATDCPHGPSEILENGKWGPLAPVGDAGALANAIANVLDHPIPRELLKEAAQKYRADYSVQKYLKVILGDNLLT